MVRTRSASRRAKSEDDPEVVPANGGGQPEKASEAEGVCTARDVLLFYPNIVGYVRVVFSLASFYYAPTDWRLSMAAYVLSFAGDLVDGKVARAFDQTSKFGGVLDMVTDRCTTAGLLFVLGVLYADHGFFFILLMVIDLSSHWIHVISVANEGHHKDKFVLENRNLLLRLYYGVYPFFGYLCVGTEFFYVFLYVLAAAPPVPFLFELTWFVCFPACVLKQLVNLAQLSSACNAICAVDAAERNAKAR